MQLEATNLRMKLKGIDYLMICIILLLTIITVNGLFSFKTDKSFMFLNQYGDNVKIFGSGIYAHDSYFKAPILIGSDFTMLFMVVPMMVVALVGDIKRRTQKTKLFLIATVATVLYYATSIVFGVTYNSLLLLYIALFSSSLFGLIALIISIDLAKLHLVQSLELPTKGLKIFLILSGIALFVAWLPDIIPTLFSGKSLLLIENYTTEVTYGIDMGIVSPMIFICLYLLNKKDGAGSILLAIILTLCAVMGAMLPMQTIYQIMAGIVIPVPVLIIKVGIFVVLAMFAVYFDIRLFKNSGHSAV